MQGIGDQVGSDAAGPFQIQNGIVGGGGGQVGADLRAGAGVGEQQFGVEGVGDVEAGFGEKPVLGVGAVENRVEAGLVAFGVDGGGQRDPRGVGDQQRTVTPERLGGQHQRAEAVLPQHRRVGGKRIDDSAGAEEIGGVETERDAVADIDAAELDPGGFGGLVLDEKFAQFVQDIVVIGKRQGVGGAKIQPPAVVETPVIAKRPLVTGVEEQPVVPTCGRGRRQLDGEAGAEAGQREGVAEVVDVLGGERRLRGCGGRFGGDTVEVHVVVRCPGQWGGEHGGQGEGKGAAHHSGLRRGR
jgi:hypothetical protein